MTSSNCLRCAHEKGPASPDAPNGLRFGQIRHAENIRAALHQQRSDLLQPMTVGVRFDDRDDLRVFPHAMANPREVSAKRGEIHFRPTTMRGHAHELWRDDELTFESAASHTLLAASGLPSTRATSAICASFLESSKLVILNGKSSMQFTFAAAPCSKRKSLFAASCPGMGLRINKGLPIASASEVVRPPGFVRIKSDAAISSCMFVAKPSTCVLWRIF